MKAKKIAALALAVLAIPIIANAALEKGSTGEDVVRAQLRLHDLGYFNFYATGSFAGMTSTAAAKFQEFNSMSINGKLSNEQISTLFSTSAIRCPIPAEVKIPIGPAATSKDKLPDSGKLEDWFESVDGKLKLNFEYSITDLNTGIKYMAKRVGGKNHAHMQASMASDIANYKKTMGSAPNWNKRPVIVQVQSEKFAASVQSFPHGDISNKSDIGYFCVYFYNSKSDILDLPDAEHDVNVLKAGGSQS